MGRRPLQVFVVGIRLLLLLIIITILSSTVHSYTHTPCHTRVVQNQFQFPNCFVPNLNQDLTLNQASFLLSHNAATGYYYSWTNAHHHSTISKTTVARPYAQTQVGTIFQQLNDGARALDVRPLLLLNGTVILQHDTIRIPVLLSQLLEDTILWCQQNPDELVVWLPSHFLYETQSAKFRHNNNNDDATTDDDDATTDDNDQTLSASDVYNAMTAIFNQYNVPYFDCTDVYERTIGDIMEQQLNGGNLLILMNPYGQFCGKENWIPSQLVYCVQSNGRSCTNSDQPWEALQSYILQSSNNPATDDTSVLGPPASTYTTPFNEIQAFWQVNTKSVVNGLKQFSSILSDNRQSNVNGKLVDLVYRNQFNSISLLAIDNVHYNGNALLSVLRNQCGQQQADDSLPCGEALPPPKITRVQPSRYWVLFVVVTVYCIWLSISVWYHQRPKLLYTAVARCWEQLNNNSGNDDKQQELLEAESSTMTI